MYQYIRYENKKAWLAANKDHEKPVEQWLWYGAPHQSLNDIQRNGLFQTLQGKYSDSKQHIVFSNHFYVEHTNNTTLLFVSTAFNIY